VAVILGMLGSGWAVRTMSSEDERTESLTVIRSTYVPEALKLAGVLARWRLVKLTVPGPLISLQLTLRVFPAGGNPSSVTDPSKLAAAGNVMAWSGPALTTGA